MDEQWGYVGAKSR
ncbi:hypothetical protein ABMO22_004800, partial [Escherichia coli]